MKFLKRKPGKYQQMQAQKEAGDLAQASVNDMISTIRKEGTQVATEKDVHNFIEKVEDLAFEHGYGRSTQVLLNAIDNSKPGSLPSGVEEKLLARADAHLDEHGLKSEAGEKLQKQRFKIIDSNRKIKNEAVQRSVVRRRSIQSLSM